MKRFFTLFYLCCLLLIGSFALQAQTIYITPSGSGTQTGDSWDNAAPGNQLQSKISGAASGTQLRVATGMYQPASGASYTMKEGVKIYGGFVPGATSLSQRNFATNPTILQGNGNSVIRNDNNGLSAGAVLDGFTITGGNADIGGGMYNSKSSPTITNCTFSTNTVNFDYGGGMYNYNSSPTVTNCTFSTNTAGIGGGGMYNYFKSSPTVTNCTFSANTADYGGGMYNWENSSPTVTNCTFSANSVRASGGGMYNIDDAFPTITNCTFSANMAREGGGIFNYVNSSPTVLTNCIIWGNMASTGPAIANSRATATVSYSIVQGGYPGTGNLDTDPLFVNAADPDGADDIFGTADDGLKMQSTSPAVNSGNNAAVPAGVTTDVTGAPRIQGCTVDMGAYESAVPAPATLYVDSSKAVSGNGSSWDYAYKTLTEALSAANGCTEVAQIWVAKGTYQPVAGASYTMVPNVKIYGGFTPGATSPSQRNVGTNPTILKGNGGSVIYNNNSLSTTAVLDGFTITGGNAASGGGMYNDNSSPTITNCIFSANTSGVYGGGMYNSFNCSPIITNCTFSANTAGDGGGVFNNSNSSPILTNCTFSANKANQGNGGGMCNMGSSPALINCTFIANKARDGGGVFNNSSSPTISNCTFSANTAGSHGGGMLNVSSSSTVVTNCIIWGNSAPTDPAIYNSDATTTVTYSIVQGGYTGTGNLDADPLFVNAADPDGADDTFGTADDGLKLQSASPAVNSGNNSAVPAGVTTDVTGAPRIQGDIVDRGAYESPYLSNSITTSVTATSICSGAPVAVTYTAMGTYVSGNGFTAQLSNAGGSFASPVAIGSVTATASSTINATIPAGTPAGTGYRIRVVSSTPAVTGTDNGSNITISELPAAPTVSSTQPTCSVSTGTITVTAPTGAGLTYSINGTAYQPSNVFSNVTPGNYSVTAKNNGGCVSAATPATINPPPASPAKPIITASGPTTFYTGGSVTLLAPAGFAAYLWSNGTTTQSITVSMTGSYKVTVTNSSGCQSAASDPVTVTVKASLLSVSHLDGDNNQPANNTVRPYLQLNNEGTAAVAYKDLTVRYWLTVEDYKPMTNLVIDWAQLGTGKVKMTYVKLGEPRQGAYGYIEYTFDATAGNLAAGSNSGPIQSRAGKSDWTNFNEANDYSFAAAAAYTKNSKITLYQNGTRVWGTEPATVTSVQSLRAFSQDKSNGTITNTLSPWARVNNEGNKPVSFADLTLRYWFTSEGTQPLNYYLDYAQLGNSNVKYKFVKLPTALNGADTYLELSFAAAADSLYPLSSTGDIQQRIAKSDWSNFNQLNDHSYKAGGTMTENAKLTVYVKGVLVYGTEPVTSANARTMGNDVTTASGKARGKAVPAEEGEGTGLRVKVLNNPVRGGNAELIVYGAEDQSLRINIVDAHGRVLAERQWSKINAAQKVSLPINGIPAQFLFVRASTSSQTVTTTLLKAD